VSLFTGLLPLPSHVTTGWPRVLKYVAGDADGGEDEDAAFDRDGAQDLAAHQSSGEVART
jgi:hypothetical protein